MMIKEDTESELKRLKEKSGDLESKNIDLGIKTAVLEALLRYNLMGLGNPTKILLVLEKVEHDRFNREEMMLLNNRLCIALDEGVKKCL